VNRAKLRQERRFNFPNIPHPAKLQGRDLGMQKLIKKVVSAMEVEGCGWPPRSVDRGQATTDGVLCKLRQAVELQFIHNLPAVGIDRLDADVKLQGYLLGGLAVGQQLEDLTFPVGQAHLRRAVVRKVIEVAVHNNVCDFRAKIDLVMGRCIYGFDQFGKRMLFVDVS